MVSEKREEAFARRSLRAYQLYLALAERETSFVLQSCLNELAHISREQFHFWARRSGVRGDMVSLSVVTLYFFRTIRLICGVSFIARSIIHWEERGIESYRNYCKTCIVDADIRMIRTFIDRKYAMVARLKEDTSVS